MDTIVGHTVLEITVAIIAYDSIPCSILYVGRRSRDAYCTISKSEIQIGRVVGELNADRTVSISLGVLIA